MTHSDCTKNLLQIKDTHITLEGELLEETLKDRQVYRIQGK